MSFPRRADFTPTVPTPFPDRDARLDIPKTLLPPVLPVSPTAAQRLVFEVSKLAGRPAIRDGAGKVASSVLASAA